VAVFIFSFLLILTFVKHPKMKASLSLFSLATLAFSQSTSITSFFLGDTIDPYQSTSSTSSSQDDLVASVVSADAQQTVYYVTCAPSVDGSLNDCGFGPGIGTISWSLLSA
jgi:hypothetical protein